MPHHPTAAEALIRIIHPGTKITNKNPRSVEMAAQKVCAHRL